MNIIKGAVIKLKPLLTSNEILTMYQVVYQKTPRLYTESNFPTYKELESYGVHRLTLQSYDRVKSKYLNTPIPDRKPTTAEFVDLDEGVPWHHEIIASAIEYEL